MNYTVLFNEEAPKDMLEYGDTMTVFEFGYTEEVNKEFGPMDHNDPLGLPYQQLERIRVLVERDSLERDSDSRGLLPGDAIVLGEHVYVYDSHPRVGGFYPAAGHIARCVLDSLAT